MTDNGNADQTTEVVEGGQETGSANTPVEEEKQFTQSELNALIAERLKRERAKYERESAAAAEQQRISTLEGTEQALELARVEAREEVRKEYATSLAEAQIRAELTGLVDDPASVVEDLNLGKFINPEDYSVNVDAVKALKAKYQALLDGRKNRATKTLQPGRSDNVKTNTPKDDFLAFLGQ